MRNFESRFPAQVAKFNSISQTTKLPECLTALMLLSNSNIDDAQRVSVLASASSSDSELNAQSTNDEFLNAITYQSVASVIKQCDHQNTNDNLMANSAQAHQNRFFKPKNGFKNNFKNNRPPLPKEVYDQKTKQYPCHKCGKYGHWAREHYPDGKLKPGAKSFERPDEKYIKAHHNNDEKNQKTRMEKNQFPLALETYVENFLIMTANMTMTIGRLKSTLLITISEHYLNLASSHLI